MFSVVPVPYFDWDEDSMEYVMPCLPLVGVMVGGLWALGAWLLSLWGPPVLLHGLLLALLPLLLTGMIHLDGFMDTMDALLSCREKEERLRILKDPRMGAMGTAAFGILLLAYFCCGVTIAQKSVNPLLFVFVPILSRAVVSSVATITPPLSKTGYLATFFRPRGTVFRWVQAVFSIVMGLLPFLLWGGWYLWPILAAAVCGRVTADILKKQFGGFSGDLCGCIVTVSELAALLCMALV